MCTADDTLLTMPLSEDRERLPVGFGQTRKCTDWGALRDFAVSVKL